MFAAVNNSIIEEDCSNPVFPACYNSSEEFVGYMYIDAPLNIMGIVTNILNLLVFHQRPFRVPVTAFTLLRAMAVADLLACTCIFPIGFCRCFPPSEISWQAYIQQFYDVYVYLPVANWFGTVSIWLTMCVSIERYMSVASPVLARTVWSISRARILLAGVFIGAFGTNMPFFFLREISDPPPPRYTAWGKSKGADIYFIFRILLSKIIPVLVVITVNILLLYAIWSLNKRHKEVFKAKETATSDNQTNSRTQARANMQMRVTLMVISISIVFITCHALEPFVHDAVFGAIFGLCSVYGRSHRIFIIYTNSMETFTYASNFFFYCLFNKQFAGALRKMCRCRCCKTKVQDFHHTMTDYSVEG